jgi:hypothetical protein
MRRESWVLCALLLPLLISAQPVAAQEYTIWQSPWTITGPTGSVNWGPGANQLVVRITRLAPGFVSVEFPVFLPSNVVIKNVQVCYNLSNSSTFIDEVLLTEILETGPASAYIFDLMDLTSTTPTCHTSIGPSVNPYSPGGSMTVVLVLNFADASHWIEVGAIGVTVEPAP